MFLLPTPILAATPTALAAISVGPLVTGQMAWVTTPARIAGAQMFVLSPATAGAANADNVVATLDDTSRQWIQMGLLNGALLDYVTPIIDFTATGTTLVVPAVAGYYPMLQGTRTYVTTTAGSISTNPTCSQGNNSPSYNNIGALATTNVFTVGTFGTAAFTTGAPVQAAGIGGIIQPTVKSVAGAAVYFNIGTGATGTGGFQLKGRVVICACYVPV